jgi:TatD DNase family protein
VPPCLCVKMYIDIHRHSSDKGKADLVLRNLFHTELDQLTLTPCCSAGLHPWHVTIQSLDKDIELLENAASSPTILAIGETGIDKAIEVDITIQRIAFSRQIEIARLVNKPMIIHCVRAYDELLSFRKNSHHQKSWIFHWFNAAPQTAFDLIHKDCYLSFGHMLFKEESKAFKSFLKIPLDRIFLETDDAGVTITEVYERAAHLKGISLVQLQRQIKANFATCFGRIL